MEKDFEQYLRDLAYKLGADFEAEQEDWDLLHTSEVTIPLFYEFAADTNCPNRTYFLHCLYLFAGDFVKKFVSAVSAESIAEDSEGALLLRLLSQTSANANVNLKKWARRVRDLLADPSKYDYDDWAGGGFAEEDE